MAHHWLRCCHALPDCWRALALLLCAVGAWAEASAQPACDPSTMCCLGAAGTGSTCGGAGVATQGNVSGLDLGVGNPINLLNGNKFQREVDMAALPGVLGLELVRYYNSSDTRRGPLGRGWRLSYETELRLRPRGLEMLQADGTRLIFEPDRTHSGIYRTRDPLQGLVQSLPGARGTEYLWRWADGRELRFDARGQLEQIRVPSGEFVSLRHDERGALLEVVDPAGRRLVLNYLDKASARSGVRYRGVQNIDTPVGRYGYEHGGSLPAGSGAPPSEIIANLVRVHYPAVGWNREYHHEDARFPTLLTGISVQGGTSEATHSERISTWAYDAQRRAVLSVRGERPASGAGTRQVDLQWRAGSKGQVQALLRNHLGQSTAYTIAVVAGHPRILQVRGTGCADCGPGNMRYGYDAVGRLREQTTLDEQGQAVLTRHTERDAQGRPIRVSDSVYRLGRAQPPQWRVRYAYAAADTRDPLALPDPRPVLIATPSVVAGRERISRLAYNPARQLVSVSEEGFSPVDEQGRPAPQGVPIRRSTQFDYAEWNGRSLLASIDGPLPNGALNSPHDSDVTRYEWDARGDQLQRIVRPGALATRVRRDADTGRVLELIDPSGLSTRFHRAVASLEQPTSIERATSSSRYEFDARGRLVRAVAPSGALWQVPADTQTLQPEPAAAFAADGAVQHDELGRPVAWQTAAGEPLLQASWGAPGSVAEGSPLVLGTARARVFRVLDDFGRVVGLRNPGQGWQYARYDEAGRTVQTTDPRGARQFVHWDVAGRWLRFERWAAGALAAEHSVQRRYEGERLSEESVSDDDGTRSTHYAYDERGAVLSETLNIEPSPVLMSVLPRPIRMSLSYRRGGDGRLLARVLTDSSGRAVTVGQTLDHQGRVTRLASQGALPHWLGGARSIVQAIDWQELATLAYAKAIRHGDGSVDRFEAIAESEPSWLRTANSAAPSAPAPAAAAEPAQRPLPPGQGHDAAGLPEFVHSVKGLQRLSWNAAGQLAQAQREDGRSRYVYDARGRRVLKLVFDARGVPSAQLSFYEDNRLLAEADSQGRIGHAYVHVGHRPVAQLRLASGWGWRSLGDWLFGPQIGHLHTARAGRVLSVSEGGRVIWRDAQLRAESEPDLVQSWPRRVLAHQPLRYVGQVHDEDSGLDYHGARFYEPGIGRFLSPDPTGVADALKGVLPSVLLDLYAYAGGRPDAYFDPDGAAKLTYYLIDTQPEVRVAGSVPGRWAFWLRDLSGPNALTQVLYDRGGTFLNSSANPLGPSPDFYADDTYARWGGTPMSSSDAVQAFIRFYVNDMISPDSFTVEIEDAAALQLLDELQRSGDVTRKYFVSGCSNGQPPDAADFKLVLPPVKLRALTLSPGGIAGQNDAPGGQRTDQGTDSITCKQAMTPERAFRRLKQAIEIKESGGTNCANTGCPAGTRNPSGTPASFGATQFVVSTFLDRLLRFSGTQQISTHANLAYRTLFNNQSRMTAEESETLGFTDAQGKDSGLRQRLIDGARRALAVLGNSPTSGWRTRLTAGTAIHPALDSEVQRFANETGFSHSAKSTTSVAYTMYVRMVKWAQMIDLMEGYRSRGGGDDRTAYSLLNQDSLAQQRTGRTPTDEQRFNALLNDLGMTRKGFGPYLRARIWNEGWQGFATAAIFTDAQLKSVLLDDADSLFKSEAKFDVVSDREIRWKYAQYRIARPNETEEDVVARVGYFHNAGSDVSALSSARGFGYSKGLLAIWNDQARVPCLTMETPRLALDPSKQTSKP